MGIIVNIGARFRILGELFVFLLQRRRWWMIPMIALLVLIGFFLVLAQSSAVAPFIYNLF